MGRHLRCLPRDQPFRQRPGHDARVKKSKADRAPAPAPTAGGDERTPRSKKAGAPNSLVDYPPSQNETKKRNTIIRSQIGPRLSTSISRARGRCHGMSGYGSGLGRCRGVGGRAPGHPGRGRGLAARSRGPGDCKGPRSGAVEFEPKRFSLQRLPSSSATSSTR